MVIIYVLLRCITDDVEESCMDRNMFYYLRCLAGVKPVSAVIGQSESSEMQRGVRSSSYEVS